MKKEIRKCKFCDEPIPDKRKRSAMYCSDVHYYEAKKRRSSESYHNSTAASKEIKRNEKILESFYLLKELGKEIYFKDLDSKNFNWGCSSAEKANSKNQIFKIVGKYAYHLDSLTQKITLEKWN